MPKRRTASERDGAWPDGTISASTSFSGVIGQEASGEIVIETRGLAKAFGDRQALRGVSFGAERGELLAVIGPNGAGKTTLLSILAGIRKPDSGSVSRPRATSAGCPSRRRCTGA